MTTILSPLYLVAMAALATSGCREAGAYRNIHEYPSGHGEVVVVIARPWNDILAFVDDESNLVPLDFSLDSLGTIADIQWSLDGDVFVIDSHGEGDQHIDVYRIEDLQAAQGQHVQTLPAWRKLDTYLHSAESIRWLNGHTIQFTSTGNYDHFDASTRRAEYMDGMNERTFVQTWMWDMDADTFRHAD